jgi:hypothetical protein
MSAKYIKIQSQQSANFTTTNNRIDFIIPGSYGKVTLKDSFVELYLTTTTTEVTPATGNGTYLTNLQWKNNATPQVLSNNYFNNVAVVRNARISCANHGMLEAVRRTDVLRNNLTSMTRSQTQTDSDRYINGASLKNLVNEQQYSIFQQINKNGNVPSVTNDNVPIMIRLGDILNFCDADTIDFNLLGDVKISLELNIANVGAMQVFPQVLPNGNKCNNIPSHATNLNHHPMHSVYTIY